MDGPTRTPLPLRTRDFSPLLWATLAATVGLVAAPLEPNVLEEGIVLHTAERLASGDHLYRDVISHTAPLPYELLALLFRAIAKEIAIARGAIVVLQVIGTLAMFGLARRAGAGILAHAAAAIIACAPLVLFPLFTIFFYNTIAFYLGIFAIYAASRAESSPPWALTAGIALAAVLLCKQSTGIALAALTLPAAWFTISHGLRGKRTLQIAAGGLVATIPTLSLFWLRGDLAEFVHSQWMLPIAMASAESFRIPFINLWPIGELDASVRASWALYFPNLYHLRYGLTDMFGSGIVILTQCLYVLPFAALIATGLCALSARLQNVVWLHAAFLAAMTLNLFPRADWGHLVVALPPAVNQLLLLVASGRAESVRVRIGVGGVVLATSLAAATTLGIWLHGIAGEPTFGPRVPLRPVSRAMRSPGLPRVIEYLRAQIAPGEPIFVARQEPLIYFATGSSNPTPFEGVLPGLREVQEPPILEALASTRYVVMSDIDQPIYTYYSDELPAVWAFLERHFQIPDDFPLDDASWITVLQRGRDRGPTAIDLFAARHTARAWTWSVDGTRIPTATSTERFAARHLNRPFPIELGVRGGGVDFDIEIPPSAVFQTAVGYRGLPSLDNLHLHSRGTTAIISIRPAGEIEFRELASAKIDDRPRGGRRWQPVEVDLAEFEGQRVTLRIHFRVDQPLGRDPIAWFGSPRIALRP